MAMLFKALGFMFVLYFKIHGTMAAADGNSSFSFEGFAKSPTFNKDLSLFGDAKLVSNTSSIQLTDSASGSVGGVVYKKPIKLLQGKERRSFSTYFSFSMPNEIGDVLGFVMVPTGFDLGLFGKKDNNSSSSSALGSLFRYAKNETVVGFEFDVSSGGNRARILIGSQIRNLSFRGDLVMEYGGRLSCMVEYDASSKRMMVRFRKSYGYAKIYDPFFSFSVDLDELWNGGEFMVGLCSANGNSSKAHFLHSWRFEVRHPSPVWMHSEPLQPYEAVEGESSREEEEEGVERNECLWGMLGVLVLGAVCGALGAVLALCIWTICGVRRSMVVVVPEECPVKDVSAIEEGKK